MPNRVFISYSRNDSDVLQEFLRQLDAAKDPPIGYWYDKDPDAGVQGGEAWEKRLRDEIGRHNIFCVFLTSNWGASQNCQQELEWAEQEGRTVVQVRVRPVDLPRPKKSFLPNENLWIGAIEERGRRDQYWHDVVVELRRIQTDPVAPEGRHQGSTDFERLRGMIARLNTFKQFHDLAHELYEEHSRVILDEVNEDGKLNPRTVADCISAIDNAVVQLNGLRKDKAAYFSAERDSGQITNLVDRLQESREILRNAAALAPSLDGVKNNILLLASTLGNTLTYFNERMVESAKEFDPSQFLTSMGGVLATQEAWKEEWSRLAMSITEAQGRLLKEHDTLQNLHAFVVSNEPGELDKPRTRKRFMEKWGDLEDKMAPLLDQWTARPDDAALDARTRQARQTLARTFTSVTGSFVTLDGDGLGADTLETAKRDYSDFQDAFGKYFFKLDKTLKGRYQLIGEELEHQRNSHPPEDLSPPSARAV